ncbi:hypothetical protein [Lacunimicrobium album]
MAGIQKKSTSKTQATKVSGGVGVSKKRPATPSAKKLWTNRRSGNTKLPPIAVGDLKPDHPELVAAFEEFLKKRLYAAKGDK